MSSDTPTPTPADSVKEKFKTLAEAIKEKTKEDLTELASDTEGNLVQKLQELRDEIKVYLESAPPELTDNDIANIVVSITNNPAAVSFLLEQVGIDANTISGAGDFDHEDFTKEGLTKMGIVAPTATEAADTTEETGNETEPTRVEKREKAKADLSAAILELGNAYDKFVSEVRSGEEVSPQGFPEQKVAIQKAFADLLDLEKENQIGLTEEEIITWIDAAGNRDPKKEVFLLASVIVYTGIRVEKKIPIDENDFELSADYIGDSDNEIDLSEINGETRQYLIDTYKKTKEEHADRNANSTVVQTLVSDFPEFIKGEERYSGDDVKLRLRDIVEHMILNKDQYEEYGFVRGAKKLGTGAKELGRDMMGGSAEESGAAVTDAFNKVLWTSTPETLKVSNPQKLSRLLDMSFKEIIENPQEAYKKIDELVAQYEATDDSELTKGFLKLKSDAEGATIDDLLDDEVLENKEGEENGDGEVALGLSAEILKFVDTDVAKELQRLGNTISTPHRGQPFGNEYMRYLAQTTLDGGRAKPFHEWLNEDSNIPPIQKLFYNLKGFLQTFLGGIGGKIGADKWPMIGKIVGNLNDYDKDEKNPHTKGLQEGMEQHEKEQTQLAEWNKEDENTKTEKAKYLKFAEVVGLNVKDIPEAQPKDGEAGVYENEEIVLSEGMTLVDFKAIQTKSIREGEHEFTLYAFLNKINSTVTPSELTSRTLKEWETYANLKDENENYIFTKEDFDDTTPDNYAESLKVKIGRADELMKEKKDGEENEEEAEEESVDKVQTVFEPYADLLVDDIKYASLADFIDANNQLDSTVKAFLEFGKNNPTLNSGGYKMSGEDLILLRSMADAFFHAGDSFSKKSGENDFWISGNGDALIYVRDSKPLWNWEGSGVGTHYNPQETLSVAMDGPNAEFCNLKSFIFWLKKVKDDKSSTFRTDHRNA